MKNPSHDERISSFLDDALPEADRSAFEFELKDNAELQQQVAELRQLRQDVALLPRYSVTEGFAQRVVAAAVAAAQADENANLAPARRSPPIRFKTVGRGVIMGVALAASIAILMISLPWLNFDGGKPVKIVVNDKGNNTTSTNSDNVIAAEVGKPLDIVWSSLPGKGEALVLRIRAPKSASAGTTLCDALVLQGIEKKRPTDASTYAGNVVNAYRERVKGAEGKPAAAALYLEISREELALALSSLAKPENKIEFVPGQALAVVKPAVGANLPVGEFPAAPPPTVEFVQVLAASRFVIPKTATPSTEKRPVSPNHTASSGMVRVLILVEETE